EPGEAGIRAALQEALLLDVGERRLGGSGAGAQRRASERHAEPEGERRDGRLHVGLFSTLRCLVSGRLDGARSACRSRRWSVACSIDAIEGDKSTPVKSMGHTTFA